MLSTLFAIVGGGLITLFIAIFIEHMKRPALCMKLCPPQDFDYTREGRPAERMRILHLQLENRRLPWWARWMCRSAAVQCHGTITFHHLDGQNVFGRAMAVRWGRSPEPVPIQVSLGESTLLMYNPLVPLLQRMDVHPGETEIVNVAAKFDSDDECYGWTNDNYFSDPLWRNPDWRLPKGRFLVRITINSAGETCSAQYRLINDVSVKDFRLASADPKDAARD